MTTPPIPAGAGENPSAAAPCWPPSAEAWQACRAILGHGENFPVLTIAVPRRLRRHVAVLYAWCRSTDDLGDEGDGNRTEALRRRERNLRHAWDGGPVEDPVVQATVGSAHCSMFLRSFETRVALL